MTVRNYEADFRQTLKDCNVLQITHPANIRLDEDVLKTFFVFVFRRRLEDIFKTS